jgi:HK97 family phage major capsid protein
MNIRNPRRIITRGVIDMATSAVLESDSYIYAGPMALCDDPVVPPALKTAIETALDKHFLKVKEVLTKVETDLQTYKSVQDGTKDAVAKLNVDGAKLIADQVKEKQAADARLLDMEQKLAAMRNGAGGRAQREKTIGELFIESPEFKEFLPKGKGSARTSMSPFMLKNITSISNVGGPGIFPEYLPQPVIPAFMPITFRDLIGQGTTESNTIIWVKENVFTNAAGYQGSDGSLKPQSDISYIQETIHVATIAHFIKASKQVLADFKVLQTLINNRLTWGLKYAEEQQLLYGDGATNHIQGVIPQATAFNTGYHRTGDTMLDTLRHAMLQTTLSYYPATGIALSPTDWHDIELTKDTLGRYIIGNPSTNAPAMIWGLPVAQCFSMEVGDFIVGALKLAVTLFDREEASILVSTEDSDNFVRNLVTILSEERLALAVSRPAAIIYGAFPSGSTT